MGTKCTNFAWEETMAELDLEVEGQKHVKPGRWGGGPPTAHHCEAVVLLDVSQYQRTENRMDLSNHSKNTCSLSWGQRWNRWARENLNLTASCSEIQQSSSVWQTHNIKFLPRCRVPLLSTHFRVVVPLYMTWLLQCWKKLSVWILFDHCLRFLQSTEHEQSKCSSCHSGVCPVGNHQW